MTSFSLGSKNLEIFTRLLKGRKKLRADAVRATVVKYSRIGINVVVAAVLALAFSLLFIAGLFIRRK